MTTPAQQSKSEITDIASISPFTPVLPRPQTSQHLHWGRLYGSSAGLALCAAARQHPGPVVVITTDMRATETLEHELEFYRGRDEFPILTFPDRETLPYDVFSPHQDITSQRIGTLYK